MEHRRRFRFLKELAAGGFGKVYLAEMVSGDNFSSVVAIKILHGKWLGNDEIVMRSRDEARLLGRLRHRSIVRVEDLTSINGQCAIVMEYLHGADLKTACTWLKDNGRTFPRRAAFEAVAAVADALDAAYNARPIQGGEPLRVIHRDIKPSNVMITVEGDVKVLDFGTARASFEDREAKTQALAFGSAAYMAPERHMGEDDTVSADVFSLGVTAYEVLSLEGYGKIQVRPERYEQQLREQLAVLDLRGMDADVRADALILLQEMLAYEMAARPTAAQVRERAESLAERMKDTPLRRFAREVVAPLSEVAAEPMDPADSLAGSIIHEDTGGVGQGGETHSTVRTWDEPPAADTFAVAEPATSRPPPAPQGLATVRPTERRTGGHTPGPVGLTPGPMGRPRPSNISLGSAPTIIGFDDAPVAEPASLPPLNAGSAGASGATARPLPGRPLPDRPLPDRPPPGRPPPPGLPPDEPSSLVQTRVPPTEPELAPEPEPQGSGIAWKLGLAAGLLVLLGMSGIGAGWALYQWRQPDVEPTEVPVPVPDAPRDLVAGSDVVDWSANAAGKGGALLTVAGGAVEVVVTNAAGFRVEWTGAKTLRLRDLAPGVYRTKVKASASSPSARADFVVEENTTCALRFVAQGTDGTWERGECR